MIEAIFIVLAVFALASFFCWLAVRSLRLGQLEIYEGFGRIVITKAGKPFAFWFNVVGLCLVSAVGLLTSLYLVVELLKGAASQ